MNPVVAVGSPTTYGSPTIFWVLVLVVIVVIVLVLIVVSVLLLFLARSIGGSLQQLRETAAVAQEAPAGTAGDQETGHPRASHQQAGDQQTGDQQTGDQRAEESDAGVPDGDRGQATER